jgi:lysophospholipase L1-like esterase
LKRRGWLALGLLAGLIAVTLLAGAYWLGLTRGAAFWESAIAQYEEADRANPPEPGAILFTGSSSIRLWGSLAEDMVPLRVLNRGFGGSHIDHVSHFVTRIVLPYRPSAVVLYAGDNDLAEGSGKTPASVVVDLQHFVRLVHTALPDTPVYFVAIKPSLARWDRWPAMRSANRQIAAWAARSDEVEYIDIATPMLGESGEPRSEFFRFDGLHLSGAGYEVWTDAIRPLLLARFAPG